MAKSVGSSRRSTPDLVLKIWKFRSFFLFPTLSFSEQTRESSTALNFSEAFDDALE